MRRAKQGANQRGKKKEAAVGECKGAPGGRKSTRRRERSVVLRALCAQVSSFSRGYVCVCVAFFLCEIVVLQRLQLCLRQPPDQARRRPAEGHLLEVRPLAAAVERVVVGHEQLLHELARRDAPRHHVQRHHRHVHHHLPHDQRPDRPEHGHGDVPPLVALLLGAPVAVHLPAEHAHAERDQAQRVRNRDANDEDDERAVVARPDARAGNVAVVVKAVNTHVTLSAVACSGRSEAVARLAPLSHHGVSVNLFVHVLLRRAGLTLSENARLGKVSNRDRRERHHQHRENRVAEERVCVAEAHERQQRGQHDQRREDALRRRRRQDDAAAAVHLEAPVPQRRPEQQALDTVRALAQPREAFDEALRTRVVLLEGVDEGLEALLFLLRLALHVDVRRVSHDGRLGGEVRAARRTHDGRTPEPREHHLRPALTRDRVPLPQRTLVRRHPLPDDARRRRLAGDVLVEERRGLGGLVAVAVAVAVVVAAVAVAV
eukprot:Rhum_TRINITY_DN2805_c0_g1::Rhum_TRINITY_DN2805_c0_g1_i1::g.8440::m.8440